MSNTHLDRAKILTEALPYIQRYNGKIVVVNCGGVAMDAELRDAVATDITMLRLVGIKVVLEGLNMRYIGDGNHMAISLIVGGL